MNAYERGKWDYMSYSYDNPYDEGTIEHIWWTQGYSDAEQADFADFDDE